MMCLWASHKKKYEKKYFFHASLQSMKKGVGFISQRYGSGSGSAPKCHGSPTLASTPQWYIHTKSTTVYVPASELVPPTPLSRQPVCPSPPEPNGWVRGWGGVLHLFISIVPSPRFAISFLGPEPDVAF